MTELNSYCDLIMVAGGSGKRFGSDVPKQFEVLNGRPLFLWSLDVFLSWPKLGAAVIVVPQDWVEPVQKSFEIIKGAKDVRVVSGGKSRQASATLGLKALSEFSKNTWVMIHDAARPAITDDLLNRLWDARNSFSMAEVGGIIPALEVNETVKVVEIPKEGPRFVQATLPREKLFVVQTPQLLQIEHLKEAYEAFPGDQAVDDACLVEKLGLKVIVVSGEYYNIKVTFPEDKDRVSRWLGQRHPQV